MAVIVLPNRAAGTRPPWMGIDWSSPQASGLVHWWPIRSPHPIGRTPEALGRFDGNRLYFDNGGSGTSNDYNYPVVMSADGEVLAGNSYWHTGTWGGAAWNNLSTPLLNATEASVSFWGIRLATSTTQVGLGSTSSGNMWLGPQFHTDGNIYWVMGNGAYYPAGGTSNTPLNVPRLFVQTYGGSNIKGYINGVEVASGGGPSSLTSVGYLAVAGTNLLQAYDIRLYNRKLPPAEVAAMFHPSTRWSLYRQPSRRAYLDLGVIPVTKAPGLGAVTLAGAAGSAFRLQYARPATDVSADGWKPITGASLAAMIDESGTPTP